MARKREERNRKSFSQKKKDKRVSTGEDNESYCRFNSQLAAIGLTLREIPGDGNCLFRALGDQLDGHSRDHLKHRQDTVEYMHNHRADFEPFVEDDVPFDRHVNNLGRPGTYAGNDAIVAFARLHGVTVVIHQLGTALWQICGAEPGKKNVRELHIAYHNGDHYNSVRKLGDLSESPANIKLNVSNTSEWNLSAASIDSCPNGVLPVHKPYDEISALDVPDLIVEVMEKTGCQDTELIKETLVSQKYDLNDTVDWILDLSESADTSSHSASNSADSLVASANAEGLWAEEGTGTRLFGKPCLVNEDTHSKATSLGADEGAKPKLSAAINRNPKLQPVHLSNRQRRDLKRQQRKRNSDERKRNELKEDAENESTVLPTVINDLGCLKI